MSHVQFHEPSAPSSPSLAQDAALAVLLVDGVRLKVTSPVWIFCRAEGNGDYLASALEGRFEVMANSRREALLDLQDVMEQAFLDLAACSNEQRTEDANEQYEVLKRFFSIP